MTARARSVLAVSIIAALAGAAAHAEWSSDPAANLVLADGDNEQVQAKIVPTADGGFYVSWFDNSTGGYDVVLQRLDARGNELWPHGGILIADRDLSSTEDYGLDVDADGNAVLAWGDDSGGPLEVVAQKVAPDGTFLWGDAGINVSDDPSSAHAPHLAALANGNTAIGWSSEDDGAVVQVVDADGNAVWAAGGVAVSSDPTLSIADVHGDADGNVIASAVVLSFSSPHTMSAQKLAAADGAPLWGADPVLVEDATDGSLQFGNFPPFIADGAGGAVFVWYTVGDVGEVHVQHLSADGTPAFAQNGVLASNDASRNHFEPAGAYDAASGDIYAVWRETDLATQGQIGVYAQRIDATGALQWGDAGLELEPLSPVDQSQVNALAVPGGGLIAAWATDDAPDPMPLRAARIATDGTLVWPDGGIVDFSTEATDAGRLTGVIGADGYAAFVWTGNAASFAGDVLAQNVNMDGTLGVFVDPADRVFTDGFDGSP